MSKSQRTKGAAYEREVAQFLSDRCGRRISRNITQSRDGGADIVIPPFVIECKRRKTLGTVESWLQQAEAATPTGKVPVVIGREDGGKSLVIMRLSDWADMAEHASYIISINPEDDE